MITEKFICKVWNNNAETRLLENGIINYFRNKGLQIYYRIDDPFKLLGIIPQDHRKKIKSLTKEADNILDAEYGVKYLADELLSNPIKAPLCLLMHNNKLKATNGQRKLVSMALINKILHPVIIVTPTVVEGLLINNDDELYNLLKSLDPSAKRFSILIEEYQGIYGFHFIIKDAKHMYWEKGNYLDYPIPTVGVPATVGFLGKATTTDPNIIPIMMQDEVERISSIEVAQIEVLKTNPINYICTVYSPNPVNITLDYLQMAGVNLYKQVKVLYGYTDVPVPVTENEVAIRFNVDIGYVEQIIRPF